MKYKTHARAHTHTHTQSHIHANTHTYALVHTSTFFHTHKHTHTHTHIHTHTHTRRSSHVLISEVNPEGAVDRHSGGVSPDGATAKVLLTNFVNRCVAMRSHSIRSIA